VRADVAILRMRAAARQRSRRLRSRLGSCTKKRRDVPADGAPGRTFTSRPAPLPSQETPSDREPTPNEGPVTPRPTSGRNTTPPEGVAGIAGAPHDADRSRRHAATPLDRKASLDEKDLAFRLDDRGGCDMTRNPRSHQRRATRPGKDRSRPRTRITRLVPASRPRPETRPDAFAYWGKPEPSFCSRQSCAAPGIAESCE
jgi:hypothetical protein